MNDISVIELHQLIESGKSPNLIDVREPHEHDEDSIGGINIPVTELPFRLNELKEFGDANVVLYCDSGNRSSLAQKLLSAQLNVSNTTNLVGGMKAWKEAFDQ